MSFAEPGAEARRASDRLDAIWLVLLLVNAYLELPIALSGEAYVPAVGILATVAAYLATSRHRPQWRDVDLCLLLVSFCLLSSFAAPNWADLGSRLWGTVQIAASAVCFISTVTLIRALDRRTVLWIFGGLTVALMLLTALEVIGVTRALSDAFREGAYEAGGYRAYTADERDLSLVGFIRPKVFSSEPSLVGIGFMIFALGFGFARADWKGLALVFVAAVIEFALLGSPIALIAPMSVGLAVVLARASRLSPQALRRAKATALVLAALLGVGALGAVALVDADRFRDLELNMGVDGAKLETATSEQLRLVLPYLAAVDAMRVNPLTGLGTSSKRSLSLYSSTSSDYKVAMGNNAFASCFVFWGLAGAALFFAIVYRYLRQIGAWGLPLAVAVGSLMQTMGALESPRLWVYFGAIAATAALLPRSAPVTLGSTHPSPSSRSSDPPATYPPPARSPEAPHGLRWSEVKRQPTLRKPVQ
ncbi:MAG: hypothetical protein QM674_13655 [Burkholderiaceae bacterium]